jgi:lysyl-tRNA synthetase class 2
MPLPLWHPESLAARLPFLRTRATLTAATRAWFTARGYQEVETPSLVPVPGMEVHLHAFRSAFTPHLGAGTGRTLWLRTMWQRVGRLLGHIGTALIRRSRSAWCPRI